MEESADHMDAIDKVYEEKGFKVLMPGELSLFSKQGEKTIYSVGYLQGARMFYDKMVGILIRYALIKD